MKTYYIFGEDAVRILNEEGINALVEAYNNNEFSIGTFVFTEGETLSHEFAEAFSGYWDYAILSEEEFNKL